MRDRLLAQRGTDGGERPFEWRRYSASTVPAADIALIENASAHMGAVNYLIGDGGTGDRCRFVASRSLFITGQVLDQQYAAQPGDDLLGLARLLSNIEHVLPTGPTLRCELHPSERARHRQQRPVGGARNVEHRSGACCRAPLGLGEAPTACCGNGVHHGLLRGGSPIEMRLRNAPTTSWHASLHRSVKGPRESPGIWRE